jgi:hypothetical protein
MGMTTYDAFDVTIRNAGIDYLRDLAGRQARRLDLGGLSERDAEVLAYKLERLQREILRRDGGPTS